MLHKNMEHSIDILKVLLPDYIIKDVENYVGIFIMVDSSISKYRYHWYNFYWQNDRDNKPASIDYENSRLKTKAWYKHHKLHRVHEPALIEYDYNGKISYERWYHHGKIYAIRDAKGVMRPFKLGKKYF
jgi:hypothetical protein